MELASLNPDVNFCESKKIISRNQVRITYVGTVTTEEKLERIKELRSHASPYMSRDELFDYMAEKTLDQIDPLRKASRAEKRAAKRVESEPPAPAVTTGFHVRDEIINELGEIQLAIDCSDALERTVRNAAETDDESTSHAPLETAAVIPRTRYVSAQTNHRIWKANLGRGCEYTNESTGRRCGSKHQEQRDHILEFSKDGSNEPENLRIYCAKHNRYRWRTGGKSHFTFRQGANEV
jgi:hypothetical protein